MTNKKIYILIGLPGSGKSTYVESNKKDGDIILSSDSLRKELFSNISNQTNNGAVFTELFKRLENAMRYNSNNIYIDATNISLKDRRKIFNVINRFNKGKGTRVGNSIEIEKKYKINGIVFNISLDLIISRDLERERTVSKRIILNMFTRYAKPTLNEGFDEIIIIKDDKFLDNTFKKELNLFLEGKNNLKELLDTNNQLRASIDCEQTSLYHQENLLEHLTMILELIENDYKNSKIDKNDYKIFKLLTIFHDIGKPYVKARKKDNLERRGYKYLGGNKFIKKNNEKVEIDNYNDFQFLGHEDLSTNIYNLEFKDSLVSENIVTKDEAHLIEIIIKGHLLFHENEGESIKINKIIYEQNTDIFRMGKRFSYYDGKGRIKLLK